ncbi:MAG: hypothetical protein A2Z04_07125 [Chloroflexi bacterium RBG_16_57_9]|nr:MAG: hypothetical protein A2Z04_07125 [Chloroflexi bacterium RBG_16_57_9]
MPHSARSWVTLFLITVFAVANFFLCHPERSEGSLDVGRRLQAEMPRFPQRDQAAESRSVDLVSHLGGSVYAVAVQGTTAFVGMGPELTILDISSPSQPRRVGGVLLPGIVKGLHVVGAFA